MLCLRWGLGLESSESCGTAFGDEVIGQALDAMAERFDLLAKGRGGLRMPKRTENGNENRAPITGPAFPRMLTLEQVQETLNVNARVYCWLAAASSLQASSG